MLPGVEREVGALLAGLLQLLLLLLLLHHAPGGHAGVGVVVARPPAVVCHATDGIGIDRPPVSRTGHVEAARTPSYWILIASDQLGSLTGNSLAKT